MKKSLQRLTAFTLLSLGTPVFADNKKENSLDLQGLLKLRIEQCLKNDDCTASEVGQLTSSLKTIVEVEEKTVNQPDCYVQLSQNIQLNPSTGEVYISPKVMNIATCPQDYIVRYIETQETLGQKVYESQRQKKEKECRKEMSKKTLEDYYNSETGEFVVPEDRLISLDDYTQVDNNLEKHIKSEVLRLEKNDSKALIFINWSQNDGGFVSDLNSIIKFLSAYTDKIILFNTGEKVSSAAAMIPLAFVSQGGNLLVVDETKFWLHQVQSSQNTTDASRIETSAESIKKTQKLNMQLFMKVLDDEDGKSYDPNNERSCQNLENRLMKELTILGYELVESNERRNSDKNKIYLFKTFKIEPSCRKTRK
jgi:ATP-dependent protease ClpP protease subunit